MKKNQPAKPPERPKGLTIVSLVLIVWGFLSILVAIFTLPLWLGYIQLPGWLLPETRTIIVIEIFINIFTLCVGCISLVTAYGLWTGKRWSYKIARAVALLLIAQVVVFSLWYEPSVWVPLFVILGVLFWTYLRKPHVRKYFRPR